jgi:hypothetical protein
MVMVTMVRDMHTLEGTFQNLGTNSQALIRGASETAKVMRVELSRMKLVRETTMSTIRNMSSILGGKTLQYISCQDPLEDSLHYIANKLNQISILAYV